jgi:hypothetical protein
MSLTTTRPAAPAFQKAVTAKPCSRASLVVRAVGQDPASAPSKSKTPDSVFEYAKTLPGICDPFPNIFDPANLLSRADSAVRPIDEVKRWRESEITHGRVAMLAVLGFVVGEQVEGKDFFLNPGGHVTGPAIVHFQQVEERGFIFWSPLLFGIGLAEARRINIGWAPPTSSNFDTLYEDYQPGEIGFDPLGLCPEDPKEKYDMQTKELNNGRLAMIAIAAFVVQELREQDKIFDNLLQRGPQNPPGTA